MGTIPTTMLPCRMHTELGNLVPKAYRWMGEGVWLVCNEEGRHHAYLITHAVGKVTYQQAYYSAARRRWCVRLRLLERGTYHTMLACDLLRLVNEGMYTPTMERPAMAASYRVWEVEGIRQQDGLTHCTMQRFTDDPIALCHEAVATYGLRVDEWDGHIYNRIRLGIGERQWESPDGVFGLTSEALVAFYSRRVVPILKDEGLGTTGGLHPWVRGMDFAVKGLPWTWEQA